LYALNRRTISGATAPTAPYQNLCQLHVFFTVLSEQNPDVITGLLGKQLRDPRKHDEKCQHGKEQRSSCCLRIVDGSRLRCVGHSRHPPIWERPSISDPPITERRRGRHGETPYSSDRQMLERRTAYLSNGISFKPPNSHLLLGVCQEKAYRREKG
jgi:hypothetical protein